jgi:hypothetical protein
MGVTLASAFGGSQNSDPFKPVKWVCAGLYAGRSGAGRAACAAAVAMLSGLPIAPTCARSGGEAGAVRGRSFQPTPDVERSAWRSAPRPGPAFGFDPGPLMCDHMAGQLVASIGFGVTVAGATALQRCCNSQSIDIYAVSGPVAWLRAEAPRHVRVRVCVRVRARICARKSAILQPSEYVITYHMVMDCRTVAERLRLQPWRCEACGSRSTGAAVDILAGGYRAAAAPGASSGVERGQGGETFGDFGQLGARLVLDGGGSIEADRAGRNGGFLRVSRPRRGAVGRVLLEGWAQGADCAALFAVERQPVRLMDPRGGRAMAIGIEAPPLPPMAGDDRSSSIGREAFEVSSGLRHGRAGASARLVRSAKGWGGTFGSGIGGKRRRAKAGTAGRGAWGGLAILRRWAHASGEADRVN